MNDHRPEKVRLLASYIASGVMGEFTAGVEGFLKSLGADESNASEFNVRTFQTDPTTEHVYRHAEHLGTIQAYVSADALSLSVRCFRTEPDATAPMVPLATLLSTGLRP